MKIELLDYSIRASMSAKSDMQSVMEYEELSRGLVFSKIENIELGYLTDNKIGFCQPNVNSIVDYHVLAKEKTAIYSVMIHPFDGYGIDKLPRCNGMISNIRLLMQKNSLSEIFEKATYIKNLGYGIIIDIDGIYEYSDLELVKLCEIINNLCPNQVTIVDTTNNLDTRPLIHVSILMDNNLNDNIKIGLRTECNNRIAQNTASIFTEIRFKPNRIVVLEGTLLGLGLVRGNLCTEIMADQLNEDFGAEYDYERLITLISLFIPNSNLCPMHGMYHPAFYLSAKNQVDGEYARYYLSKEVPLFALNDVLRKVAETERFEFFDEAKAEKILNDFKRVV